MKKLLLLLTISMLTLSAEEKTLWKASMTSLAAANVMDIQSSWGKHELNGNLADGKGQFGREGALIKLGIQGGLFGVEYLITRGRPGKKVYRVLSVINFGAAGATAAVAARNYGVAR